MAPEFIWLGKWMALFFVIQIIVLWISLPFVVWNIRRRLENVQKEQSRALVALEALARDFAVLKEIEAERAKSPIVVRRPITEEPAVVPPAAPPTTPDPPPATAPQADTPPAVAEKTEAPAAEESSVLQVKRERRDDDQGGDDGDGAMMGLAAQIAAGRSQGYSEGDGADDSAAEDQPVPTAPDDSLATDEPEEDRGPVLAVKKGKGAPVATDGGHSLSTASFEPQYDDFDDDPDEFGEDEEEVDLGEDDPSSKLSTIGLAGTSRRTVLDLEDEGRIIEEADGSFVYRGKKYGQLVDAMRQQQIDAMR